MRCVSRLSPALLLLGAAILPAGCTRSPAPTGKPEPEPASVLGANALLPSPRLIVGRIIAIDPDRRFAFVELNTDAPPAALVENGELITRTLALQETGRLRVSRQQRGRTLGTIVLAGQPAPNDEVVWLAP
jgi:hypothetical protein